MQTRLEMSRKLVVDVLVAEYVEHELFEFSAAARAGWCSCTVRRALSMFGVLVRGRP